MQPSQILEGLSRLRERFAIAGALFLLAAVLTISAACGDDGPSTSPTPDGSGDPSASPTPDDSGDPAGMADGPDASPTQAPEDLVEVLTLVNTFLGHVDGKIVYDYTSNFGQHADGTYTTYYQGDLDRHDWLSRTGGFETTVVTLVTETTGYICTLVPSFPTCQEISQEKAVDTRPVYAIIPITLRALSRGAAPMTAFQLPNEQIAGVDALCYQIDIESRLIEGPSGSERMKLCFSEDGALLLMDHDLFFDDPALPQGELDFVAIEVGEATAEDFEAPAQVLET